MVDEELEALIDKAGRDKVFARARALGWRTPPEKWVWRMICADIITDRPLQIAAPPQRLDDAILGFRLF